MGSLKIGNTTITNAKIGSTQISKVYLGSNLVWSHSTYSSELQAVIDRANTEGFTLPSSTVLGHCDTLITAYKSSGVWSKQDRIYNFAYNDNTITNFSRIDWKNPSTSPLITLNGGMTYQISGYKGNGVDGYLDLNYVITTDGVYHTQDNAGRTALVYSTPTIGTAIDGSNITTRTQLFLASTTLHRINTITNLNSAVNIGGVGLKSIQRYDANNVSVFNRITENSRTAVSALPSSNPHLLFRANTNYSDMVISNYLIGSSLTSTEVVSIRNDYNTYLTNIGLTPITLT